MPFSSDMKITQKLQENILMEDLEIRFTELKNIRERN
jgi:hypothetical protein